MATRLRKLARKLGRSPDEVLGLLHRMGYVRYKSGEDMVADPVIAKLQTAIKTGLRAQPVATTGDRRSAAGARQTGAEGPSLMDQLVPGVVPLGAAASTTQRAPQVPRPRPPAKRASEAAPPKASSSPAVPPPSTADSQTDLRLKWVRTEAALAEEQRLRAKLEAEVAELRAELEREQALRAEQEQRAQAIEARQQTRPTVREVFAARGLRGGDEMSRALAGLVSGRHVDDALLECAVDDPERLQQLLQSRLVLFDTEPAQGLAGVVGVGVSPDRSEVPSGRRLHSEVSALSEALLLWGHRRVRIVGAPPMWHGWLRTQLDARLDLRFEPLRVDAEPRLDAVDVLWCWDVSAPPSLREAWAADVRCVAVAKSPEVGSALSALSERLRDA